MAETPPDMPAPRPRHSAHAKDYSSLVLGLPFLPIILAVVAISAIIFLAPAFLFSQGLVVIQISLLIGSLALIALGTLLLTRNRWVRNLVESDAYPSERGAIVTGCGVAICLIALRLGAHPSSPLDALLLLMGIPTGAWLTLVIGRIAWRFIRSRR